MKNHYLKYFILLMIAIVTSIVVWWSRPNVQVNEQADQEEPSVNDELSYSFFVAGHAYGNPENYGMGIYSPLKRQFGFLRDYPGMKAGFFTGDLVPKPTKEYWDAALTDIERLQMETFIAPGNHDKGEVFDSLFPSYFAMGMNRDLFIVLSPNQWNIEGEQLTFLENTLDSLSAEVNNVFIFCHELIYWSPENEFSSWEPNYRPHYPGTTNYWEDVHPILKQVNQPVYLFSGDVGATSVVTAFEFVRFDGINFCASGMGNGAEDNVVIVEVSQNGLATLRFFNIHGDEPLEVFAD